MKYIIPTIILIFSIIESSYGYNEKVEKVLQELDLVLENKNIYHAQKEKQVNELKRKLNETTSLNEKYIICGNIFNEYLHYQADSALHYSEMRWEYIENGNREQLKNQILINKAEAFALMGMYSESHEQLMRVDRNNLNREMLLTYYVAMRTYFGWISEYTAESEEKTKYIRKTNIYRDSILTMLDNKIDIDINKAEKFILKNEPDNAIALLSVNENNSSINLRQIASLYYTIYMAYEVKGDVNNQIYYLAKAAIADIKAPVREYASLQRLALLVFKEGDAEKGYKYLTTSMEDAVTCNARLRYIEVTELYPAISNAYKIQKEKKQKTIYTMLIVVCILSVLLMTAIFYLYRWMRKLSALRKKLSSANKDLTSVNKELKETGKIKEIYIMRYLDKCVSYLEKLEQYRRSLEKLSMASKTEELHKAIRSGQFIRDEKKNFYVEFDKSFLTIFPNFVKDFNNLLKEEEQIELKPGELMNTEIRIFALIRLGVTDAASIAHFLGCSLATVYNYRSKIRNKSKESNNNFEQSVMEL